MAKGDGLRPETRGRLLVAGIFALFFLPIALAWFLNLETPDWLPIGRANHGTLFEPPGPVETRGMRSVEGHRIGASLFKGKWTLLYVAKSSCPDACEKALYKMRQARFALGEDMQRIQRLMVSPVDAAKGLQKKLEGLDEALLIVSADAAWMERFKTGGGAAELFLVDPQGYLIIWYPQDADPSGLIKDLERLLRISKIG
jgi:cytochrome oxidase Cu insertion factor (SCO1/SenC/PrrC family)